MNVLRLVDEIEQLVEESKGFMGKRLVSEEAFFTKMQQLRAALPQAMQDAANSAAASANFSDASVQARGLSRAEKLRLIAQLSAELARETS